MLCVAVAVGALGGALASRAARPCRGTSRRRSRPAPCGTCRTAPSSGCGSPSSSARLIWCEVWQSSQTGSWWPSFGLPVAWMLLAKVSSTPWWHLPQVRRQVGAVDRRGRVGRRQLAVRRVAVDAGRGDDQAALGQPLAVDRVGVGGDDVRHVGLDADGGLFAGAMAAGAEHRHVAREGRRRRLLLALGGVVAVAVEADRSVRVPLGGELAVDALLVLLDLGGVTDAAVDLRFDRLAGAVVRRADLAVALGAADLARGSRPRRRRGRRRARPSCRRVRPRGRSCRGRSGSPGSTCRRCRRPCARLVRLVALDADRNPVRRVLPELALDHLAVHLLDLRVALGAGRDHVLLGDRRLRIGVRQDVVRRVAGGADGGDRQALLVEPLAVDRVDVVLEDVLLRDVAELRDLGALLVAASRRAAGRSSPPPAIWGRCAE